MHHKIKHEEIGQAAHLRSEYDKQRPSKLKNTLLHRALCAVLQLDITLTSSKLCIPEPKSFIKIIFARTNTVVRAKGHRSKQRGKIYVNVLVCAGMQACVLRVSAK